MGSLVRVRFGRRKGSVMNLKAKKIGMSVFGVLLCGVAVGMFKLAAFGVDPFQTLMAGLNEVFPISFGTLYVIVNVVLLLFSFFADRHYINIATFINLFLLGYVVEFSQWGFETLFPNLDMIGRGIFMIAGIVILCFGSSFYFVADLGVSTYDAISLIISNTWKLMPFKYCRILSDLVCVLLGGGLFLLAGMAFTELFTVIGVGTIVTAFFMGPLIDLFVRRIARPFLEHGTKKEA